MVTYRQFESGACSFTLSPNCALGWVGMKRLFLFFAACLALVAVGFAQLGAWLVLPFAGLELLVLGIGVYANARWGATRERINLHDNELLIQRGRNRPRDVARLPRHWTRVNLQKDPGGWYPSRLLLECHGHSLEVGRSLVETERLQLAEDLQSRLRFRADIRRPPSTALPEGLKAAGQKL